MADGIRDDGISLGPDRFEFLGMMVVHDMISDMESGSGV